MSQGTQTTGLGTAIREARNKEGLVQDDIAAALDVSTSTICRYESGEIEIPLRRLRKLGNLLNLPEGVIDAERFRRQVASRSQKYLAASFDQLVATEHYTMKWLLSQSYEVMNDHPSPEIEDTSLGCNDFGDDDKWNAVVQATPATCFAVIHQCKEPRMVGYWHVMSISDDLFNRGLNGENINEDFTTRDLLSLATTEQNLYVVDLFERLGYQTGAVLRHLLDGFWGLLDIWAREGIFVKRILAHASELEAELLCGDLGFRFVKDHKYHRRYVDRSNPDRGLMPTKIYAINLTNFDEFRPMQYAQNRRLRELYLDHFR